MTAVPPTGQPANPEVLSQTATFRGSDAALLADVVALSASHRLAAGEVLLSAGEPYRHEVFIIYRGAIELRLGSGDTYRVGPGAFVGLSNYLDGSPYGSTATAVKSTDVLRLPDTALRELEQRHPELDNVLNRFIADRLRRWSPARAAPSGVLARPVRSIMKSPLSTCTPGVTLREAFALMQSRKIGSLGVIGEDSRLVGVLTCPGMSEAVISKGISPDDSIMGAACQTPHTIDPEAPLWEAEEIQQQHGVKYLIVVEDGVPVGMVSQSDIVRTIHSEQGLLVGQIATAEDLPELASLKDRITDVAVEAREHNRLPSKAVRLLSETHLALQRRCLELALHHMDKSGKGGPPLPYALIIMGSGGRKEMLLNPDQDNGIIIADAPDAAIRRAAPWFREFCGHLNDSLDRIGYILCPGDIMARNPQFHKTLGEWKQQISHMARYPNQKAARWSNIVFDFITLHGDDGLTAELRKHLLAELSQRPKLLEFMVQDDAEGRPPLGLFNRLITRGDEEHKGKIDIKRNGLRIVADAARIFALRRGVSACNTHDRLNALLRLGVFKAEFVETIGAAYEELMDLLLGHQVEQARAGLPIDKLVDPDRLSPRGRETLRVAMRAVKRLQDRLQDEFTPSPF